MNKLFCQNTGYYNRKTKTMNGEFIEATRTQINIDATNYIIIDGKKYEVGYGQRDVRNRCDSDTHIICTKYDILKHSNDRDVINLMLALPCSHFKNRDYRDKYKRLLPNVLTGEINGIEKTVYIKNTEVYMEGAAAYLLYKQVLKDEIVGLIDVGGNTINCMVFANGVIQLDTIMTLDTGMIKLERDLIDAINIHTGWFVQPYELQNIIKRGDCKEVVDNIINRYVDHLKKSLMEKKWNIDSMYIFATGGGASTLEETLKSNFKKVVVSKHGLYDNVRGMWEAGRVIWHDN